VCTRKFRGSQLHKASEYGTRRSDLPDGVRSTQYYAVLCSLYSRRNLKVSVQRVVDKKPTTTTGMRILGMMWMMWIADHGVNSIIYVLLGGRVLRPCITRLGVARKAERVMEMERTDNLCSVSGHYPWILVRQQFSECGLASQAQHVINNQLEAK